MSVTHRQIGIQRLPAPPDTRMTAAIAALEADLLHADEGVEVSRKNWLDAGTDDAHRATHLRNIYQYNTGYRDAIKKTIDLLNRGSR